MNILLNQRYLKRSLYLGIGYIALGFTSFFADGSTYLAGLSGIGVLYVGQYFYSKNKILVKLQSESIEYFGFFHKKIIPVNEILSLKYFAGDYTIKAKHTTLVIDTNEIDKTAQLEMKAYFDALQSRINP